jgi:hypothetical protein
MLRMYLGIPVDPQLRHRDGAGPVVSSEVLTRVYLALASIGDATFGEVIPLPADFTLIPLTTFESCLVGALFQYESAYDIPAWLLANQDPISHSPQFLRGYGWLTLLTQALCEQLGGAAALASSGAVARVHSLPNGAVVLQATDRIEEYDSIRAELLWSTVSAVLRPGQPRMDALNETFTYMDRRPGVAPSPRPLRERVGRLIVMRDAEDGGTPDRSPAAQDS